MEGIVVAVWFQGSHTELLPVASLKDAVRQLLTRSYTLSSAPLKLVLESEGRTLLYDENSLQQFLQGVLDQKELYLVLSCDGLFRNKVKLFAEGEEIEPESLWMKRAGLAVLVSQDNHYSTAFNSNLFYEVP